MEETNVKGGMNETLHRSYGHTHLFISGYPQLSMCNKSVSASVRNLLSALYSGIKLQEMQ